MKLIQLYFIGIFIAIAALVASTFWQFQQFQSNIKNIPLGIPSEFTKMPDINQEMENLLKKGQTQTQDSGPAATSTKEYSSPDGSFKFKYPDNWQETNGQSPEDESGKVLFYAYKTNGFVADYLVATEMASTTLDEAVKRYKDDIWAKDPKKTISERRVTSDQGQTVEIIELNSSLSYDVASVSINTTARTALMPGNGKVYQILAVTNQETERGAQEIENIFKSIHLTVEKESSAATDI